VAARYGFLNREVFWRAFRRRFDATPAEVRRGLQKPETKPLNPEGVDQDSVRSWVDYLCR
jgi:AraC-like DNA-binding protein